MKTSSFAILIVVILFGCQKTEVASNNETTGNCVETLRNNIVCTKQYEPVCGCNNKTYSNSCEAQAIGILNYTQGECKK